MNIEQITYLRPGLNSVERREKGLQVFLLAEMADGHVVLQFDVQVRLVARAG